MASQNDGVIAVPTLNSTASASVMPDANSRLTVSDNSAPSNGVRMKNRLPAGMNTPSQSPQVNNTQTHSASAVPQISLQTTSPYNLVSASSTRDQQSQQQNQNEHQGQKQPCNLHYPSIPGLSGQTPQLSSVSITSTDENISVSPMLDTSSMTARPVNPRAQASANTNRRSADCSGRQLSHSSSTTSFKYFINDDCLVKNLPRKIVKYVAETLQCRCVSATWKDLVENYGWDYERTFMFENKQHPEGIFYSLLYELEFQDYSLSKLRQDMLELPRVDILNDLNKLINDHNASSGGVTRSHSQNGI